MKNRLLIVLAFPFMMILAVILMVVMEVHRISGSVLERFFGSE